MTGEGFGNAVPGLRVHVRPERCQGHARCVALAPELFELDEIGNSRAIGDGAVAPGLEAKARLAKANCPEFAVDVLDVDVSEKETSR